MEQSINNPYAHVAQMVVQLPCKHQVRGSSPFIGTIYGNVVKWDNLGFAHRC